MVAGLFVNQFIILFGIFLRFLLCFSLETDTISSGLVIKDPDSIISRNQRFKLGFITPPNTTNRYLGVLLEGNVVWVANRDEPLNDSSSTVTISREGNIVLINERNQTVWSTNLPTTPPVNSTLQIQDTGILLLRDMATGTTLWESFSHPTHVFLPKMKLSHNAKTGERVVLSAWKNATDPAPGSFTGGLDASAVPQNVIWKNGRMHWRSGPWNGKIFTGVHAMFYTQASVLPTTDVVKGEEGTFYLIENVDKVINDLKPWGITTMALWDDQRKSLDEVFHMPQNECDLYGRCGQFGSCNIKGSPICSCLRGFEPINKQEWRSGNWTRGCQRAVQLKCGTSDGFSRLQFMKVPDFPQPFSSYDIPECRRSVWRIVLV